MSPPTAPPRWPHWILLGSSAAILLMTLAGYATVASFADAHPGRLGEWRRVAWVYLGVGALALAGVVKALVGLLRTRGPRADRSS